MSTSLIRGANTSANTLPAAPPTLANWFGLDIWSDKQQQIEGPNSNELPIWTNPQAGCPIYPYIPPANDQDLIEVCREAYQRNLKAIDLNPAESVCMNREVFIALLAYLEPKQVSLFSRISKCFYFTMKNGYNPNALIDSIWDIQLQKMLPNVKMISHTLTSFSSEQQFKIVYKRIADEEKPYIAKFQHNLSRHSELMRRLTVLSTRHKEASDEFQQALKEVGGENIYRIREHFPQLAGQNSEARALEWEVVRLAGLLNTYKNKLKNLFGENYTDCLNAHLDQNSEQWKLRHAVDHLIPEAFNDQEKFVDVIHKSDALKTQLSRSNAAVEEENSMETSDDLDNSDDISHAIDVSESDDSEMWSGD